MGPVPRVAARLSARDRQGSALARLGAVRDDYKIVPGLYCVGEPDSRSPVLVTANYKLSFDALRRELDRMDAWILVLDTHGINVWCAAGKGTFGTQELARRILAVRLGEVVSHRRVIVPQLGATGVAGHTLRALCGFSVRFGPVYARDLRAFLENGGATPAMRAVQFSLAERAVLVPVEFWLLRRSLPWVLAGLFVLSGIGPDWFSLRAAWTRGLMVAAACASGVLAGSGLVPLALPWLPGRAFAVKGALAGLGLGLATAAWLLPLAGPLGAAALVLLSTALASWFGMNFTGSTPYTSLAGVEKEMRAAIPAQALGVLAALAAWVGAAFAGGAP